MPAKPARIGASPSINPAVGSRPRRLLHDPYYRVPDRLGDRGWPVVLTGVCLPGERHITESIETNRKMTIVYDTVNSLRRFKDWNPLMLRDPAVELEATPARTPARVPASNSIRRTMWSARANAWEITESEQNKRVAIAIDDQTSRP